MSFKDYNRALQLAERELRVLGIDDPSLTSLKDWQGDAVAYHDAIRTYSERVGSLTVKFLRMPSGDRPLEPIVKNDWAVRAYG